MKTKPTVQQPENFTNTLASNSNTEPSSETARQPTTQQSSVTPLSSEVTSGRTFTTVSSTNLPCPIMNAKRPAISTVKNCRKLSPKKSAGKSKRGSKTTTNTLKNFVTRIPNTEAHNVHFQKPDEVEDPPLPSLFTSPDKVAAPQQSLTFELPPMSEIDPTVFYELPEDVRRSITAAFKQNNETLYIEPFRPTSGLGLFEGDANSHLSSTNDWRFSNMLDDKERGHFVAHTELKETDPGIEPKSLQQSPHASRSTFDDAQSIQNKLNLRDTAGGKNMEHVAAQTAFPQIEKQCPGDESACPKPLMKGKKRDSREIDIPSGEIEEAESKMHDGNSLSFENGNVGSLVTASSSKEISASDGKAVPGGDILSMSQLDPEVMSALPEKLRKEILQSLKFEERRQSRAKEKHVNFVINKSANGNLAKSSGSSSSGQDYKEKFFPEQKSTLPSGEFEERNEEIHECTDARVEQESVRDETFPPSVRLLCPLLV